MKSRIVTCFALLLLTFGSLPAYGSELPVNLKFNGETVAGENIIREGRLFVPVRFFSEVFGASVSWFEEAANAIVEKGDTKIVVSLNSGEVWVDGSPGKTDASPFLQEGRAYLPLRFLTETMGLKTVWYPETSVAETGTAGYVFPEQSLNESWKAGGYTEEDLMWLSRIVQVESGNVSRDLELAVANVVLNRVYSNDFPDTVHDVIFDTCGAVQFPPAHKSSFAERELYSVSIESAKRALAGENNIGSCLYFNYRPFVTKADDFCRTVDGEYFYY